MNDSYKGMRRENMPLSSFDPRYRVLLLDGAKAETRIPCADLKAARRMRALICSYRGRMKKHFGEKRAMEWEPLYQTIVSVDEDKNEVVLRPRSTEFESLLRPGFDVTVREPEGESVVPLESPTLTEDPLAIFEPEEEERKDE
jgi:hypothetical protein